MTPDEENMARAAIRHTQSIYNNCGDRGRVDDLLKAFTPEGVLDIGTEAFTGRESIKTFLSNVATGKTTTDLVGSRHHLTTSLVEFEGDDAAQGWTYFFVMRRGTVVQEGTYIDRFMKTDGRWLIAHRRVKMLYHADD